jgi:probable poly-beta-1,6-N-acetyl-D-glucosamine export protein
MRYFPEITIMRAFAILAVISLHVSGNFTFMDPGNFLAVVYMAIGVISGFAVPLFICISGFVLYNKYPDKIDLKTFYKKRLMSVVPPYIVFSTIYLIFERMRTDYLPLQTIVYKYLTGGWNYSYWFFILIIEFYLLYPVITRIYHYCEVRGRSFELLCITFLTGIVYSAVIEPALLLSGGAAAPILEIATRFIVFLFYFILGILVRSRYDELLLKPVSKTSLCCMSVPLLCGTAIGTVSCLHTYFRFNITRILPVVGNYWDWITTVIFPLYYVVIISLCFMISLHIVSHKREVFRLLETIGHYSFGIYLIHLFFLSEIVRVISRYGFGWNNWLFYPITFGLTIILSTLSVGMIQKLPYSSYIIGKTR